MTNQRVFDLAHSQSGIIARRQLTDLGWSASRVDRARRSGWLSRLLPGTFLVAPAANTHEARCFAVQTWINGNGVLTGRTAGRLLGLSKMGGDPIQCLVPHRRVLSPAAWVEVHRSRWYSHDRHHTKLASGLTVTNPLRTLFALAAFTRTQRRFDHIADDAWNLGLITPDDMADYLAVHRCRGKDGVAFVEGWLERSLPERRPTQSYFERDLLDALDRTGLPPAATQHPLDLSSGERIHLDIAWPDVRLAIEPGHTRFHDPAADAVRDLACGELGWMVHRLTEHTRSDLDRFARLIAASYRRRRRDIAPYPSLPKNVEKASLTDAQPTFFG